MSHLIFYPRFPNNPWSYEACATPLPVAVAPVAPSAAFTAPVGPSHGQHHHVPSVPSHGHHHHVPSVPSYGHPASGASGSLSSGYGSGYGSAGSLYGSNLGTLQPYGNYSFLRFFLN